MNFFNLFTERSMLFTTEDKCVYIHPVLNSVKKIRLNNIDRAQGCQLNKTISILFSMQVTRCVDPVFRLFDRGAKWIHFLLFNCDEAVKCCLKIVLHPKWVQKFNNRLFSFSYFFEKLCHLFDFVRYFDSIKTKISCSVALPWDQSIKMLQTV